MERFPRRSTALSPLPPCPRAPPAARPLPARMLVLVLVVAAAAAAGAGAGGETPLPPPLPPQAATLLKPSRENYIPVEGEDRHPLHATEKLTLIKVMVRPN